MKLIIAGTRDMDLSQIELFPSLDMCNLIIVSGESGNVDLEAKRFAKEYGLRYKGFMADWKKYLRAAGPIRNGEMADYVDELLLIWNGCSRGSKSMKKEMMKQENL